MSFRPGMTKSWAWLAVGVVCLIAILFSPLAYRWGYAGWQTRVARGALARGDLPQALAALRATERLDPNRAETLYLLGRALRRTDEPLESASYLDRAGAAGWPKSELDDQRCLLLAQAGMFDKADPRLDEMFRKGCTDDLAEEIYEAKCKGYLSTYRLTDALLCLEYWLKWRPHARQARMWRADIYDRTSTWQPAMRDYRAIIEHDPQDTEARLKLARVLTELHDDQAAIDEYEKCLAIHPDDVKALVGVLKARRRMGELTDIKEQLAALLERPLTGFERSDLLCELGELALLDRDYQRAFDYLVEAQKLDPTNQSAYAGLAHACARLGKTEMAAEMSRLASQTFQRYSRLTEVAQQIIIEPQNPEPRYETGMLLMAQGMRQEGAAWLESALKCDPHHVKSHAALAEYFSETGDIPEADRHRKLAEDLEQSPLKTEN